MEEARLVRLPREWSRCCGVRVACSDWTPPSECRECTSRGVAGSPECGGSRHTLAECLCRSPGKETGQRGRALTPLSQVVGLQLVPQSVVALWQVARLVEALLSVVPSLVVPSGEAPLLVVPLQAARQIEGAWVWPPS